MMASSGSKMITSFTDVRLIPFYLSVGAYFILYKPYLQYPVETVDASIVKAIPIWSLALFVHNTKASQQTVYAPYFTLGLLVSSFGDMCLIWRQDMFIPGILFFASAHVCYLLGLARSFHFKKTRSGVLFLLLNTALFLFISDGIVSTLMKVLVLIYQSLILGVGWLSVEHFLYNRTLSTLFLTSGSALFMFSDFLIAFDKWKFHLPLVEMIIMTTYYAGQLCLAISTART